MDVFKHLSHRCSADFLIRSPSWFLQQAEGFTKIQTACGFTSTLISEVVGGPHPRFGVGAGPFEDGFEADRHDGRRGGYPGLRGPSRSVSEAASGRLGGPRRGQDPRKGARRPGGLEEDHFEAAAAVDGGAGFR